MTLIYYNWIHQILFLDTFLCLWLLREWSQVTCAQWIPFSICQFHSSYLHRCVWTQPVSTPSFSFLIRFFYRCTTKLLGVYWFHSVRPSVRPSVRLSVCASCMPCPLCNVYSYGWILSILGTNDHYHERVWRTMTFDLDLYLQGHSGMTLQWNC